MRSLLSGKPCPVSVTECASRHASRLRHSLAVPLHRNKCEACLDDTSALSTAQADARKRLDCVCLKSGHKNCISHGNRNRLNCACLPHSYEWGMRRRVRLGQSLSEGKRRYPFSRMPTKTRKSPFVGNSQKLTLLHNHVVKPFHPATPVNKRGKCTPDHQRLPLSGGVTEWIQKKRLLPA